MHICTPLSKPAEDNYSKLLIILWSSQLSYTGISTERAWGLYAHPQKEEHMRSKCHLWRTARSSNAKVRPEPHQVAGVRFFWPLKFPLLSPHIRCWKQHIRISCYIGSLSRWSLNAVKYHKCHQLLSECFFLTAHCGKNSCALMAIEVLSCPPFSWPFCV